MMKGKLEESIGVREDIIKKACSLAHKAYKSCSSNKLYLVEKSRGLSEALFAFPGSWVVEDWYSGKPFGEGKIDLELFPSLRSIGNDEVAVVNCAFFRRFEAILGTSPFVNEVNKAVADKKQLIFTGHSSGGPIAIFVTLWFLEQYIRPNKAHNTLPQCVTFGSPLVGDRIFPHALIRENWDHFFVHFTTRYDIIPRLMLSPLSSIEGELQEVFHSLNSKKAFIEHASSLNFFTNVMINASTVASYAACDLMGSTSPLLSSFGDFVDLSLYRPFGTYVFCIGDGKMVVVKNPDAVMQIFFYSCQLNSEAQLGEIANRSLKEHLGYENEMQKISEIENVVCLDDHLEKLPLSANSGGEGEVAAVNLALTDLGLSTRARLCLRAAADLQKRKLKKLEKINSNTDEIRARLAKIKDYQTRCEQSKIGYYDSFKIQNHEHDFQANIMRLEVAGTWDEIIEMLKKNELPEKFEGEKEWIELGTEFRRLVEPLDIANYYRHLKNEDTGPYVIKARPKRYRYTQRWREHDERMKQGFCSESCSWARIEEMKNSCKSFEEMKEAILVLETDLLKWFRGKQIGGDLFLADSTFSKWWKTLPLQHRNESCLGDFMNK